MTWQLLTTLAALNSPSWFAKYQAAERERDELKANLAQKEAEYEALRKTFWRDKDQAERRVSLLAEALKKYGQHLKSDIGVCGYYHGLPCTCGFEATLTKSEKGTPK